MAAADQAEGHSRIQLATGNMQGSRNKGGDRETVSKGDSDDIVPGVLMAPIPTKISANVPMNSASNGRSLAMT